MYYNQILPIQKVVKKKKKKRIFYENPFSSILCFAYKKVLVIWLYINNGCTLAMLSSLWKCLNSENSSKYKVELILGKNVSVRTHKLITKELKVN